MKRNLKDVTIILCCVALQFVFLSACSNSNNADSEASSKKEISTASNKQDNTNESKVDKEVTDNNEINKNNTGKTVIKAISKNFSYPNNSYMIISKSGTVLVVDPTMVIDGIKPDIITSTHAHPDHVDPKLESKTKCKKSYYKVEAFSVKDINVSSFASSHMGNDINMNNPSNVIYVYEVDGLRIAHMGDIGQDQLTDDQLKALGKIDIAFMQFVNSYSGYSTDNEKGFKLIEQLKPQIIIPTHSDEGATKKISDIVGSYVSVENVLTISKDDLKDGKRKVIEIKNKIIQNLY